MALMPINDRLFVKQIVLSSFSSAKLLLLGVNVVHFSDDHNIVICRLAVDILDPFLHFQK